MLAKNRVIVIRREAKTQPFEPFKGRPIRSRTPKDKDLSVRTEIEDNDDNDKNTVRSPSKDD